MDYINITITKFRTIKVKKVKNLLGRYHEGYKNRV